MVSQCSGSCFSNIFVHLEYHYCNTEKRGIHPKFTAQIIQMKAFELKCALFNSPILGYAFGILVIYFGDTGFKMLTSICILILNPVP